MGLAGWDIWQIIWNFQQMDYLGTRKLHCQESLSPLRHNILWILIIYALLVENVGVKINVLFPQIFLTERQNLHTFSLVCQSIMTTIHMYVLSASENQSCVNSCELSRISSSQEVI